MLALHACIIPLSMVAAGPAPVAAAASQPADAVVIGPVFNRIFTCTEHYAGQFTSVGDALGTDCHVQQLDTREGRTWMRSYRTDGRTNEDWYGFKADVLSPVSGRVMRVNVNPVVNVPGVMGSGMASFVVLGAADGLMVMVAHVDDVKVRVGDVVTTGQVIGRVGNNGQSRHPHVHVGAWKDERALQIRFDQVALARAYQP